jgi:hypothetical protein
MHIGWQEWRRIHIQGPSGRSTSSNAIGRWCQCCFEKGDRSTYLTQRHFTIKLAFTFSTPVMITAASTVTIHIRFCFKILVASFTIHMVWFTSVASFVLNQHQHRPRAHRGKKYTYSPQLFIIVIHPPTIFTVMMIFSINTMSTQSSRCVEGAITIVTFWHGCGSQSQVHAFATHLHATIISVTPTSAQSHK